MFDVLVVGGGMAGVTAALTAARAGASVILVEQRGCLGWEVTRARRVLSKLEHTDFACELRRELSKVNGYKDGVLNTAFTEGLLDHLATTAGVELLFHAWPVNPIVQNGAVAGALFATRFGRLPIRCKTLIDCSHTGQLAFQLGYSKERVEGGQIWHSVVLIGTRLKAELTVEEGLPTDVRLVKAYPTAEDGEAQLDILLDIRSETPWPKASWLGEVTVSRAVVPLIQQLRQRAEFAESVVAHLADESWFLPSCVTEATSESQQKVSGVSSAGAYVKEVHSELATGGREIETLIRLGETAKVFT